jgi:hypothetical protein
VSKKALRLHIAFLVAGVIVGTSVGQVEKQGAGQRPNRPDPSNVNDGSNPFAGAIKLAIEKMVKEFEIKDDMEVAFFFSGFDALKGVRFEGGSVLSLVIFKKGEADVLGKAYEERFDDRWIFRFSRATSPDVKVPVAVVTNAYSLNGRTVVSEQVLRFDVNTAKWRRWSKSK